MRNTCVMFLLLNLSFRFASMKVLENISLKSFNTFGIEASCRYFVEVYSDRDFIDLLEIIDSPGDNKLSSLPLLILGGGSNILLCEDFDGIVIKNNIKGIGVVRETDDHVFVKAGAGESWHEFVMHCIDKGYGGIENLSLIPGNVGASPMQNIGAYGVEIKDVFEELEAIHIKTGELKTFTNEVCKFGYRESIFKNKVKGEYFICNVTYRLNKKPKLNTTYGAIEKELVNMGVQDVTIKEISQAVINIRQSKLPDPAEIGNSGSFFKNPIISNELFEAVQQNHPEIVNYPVNGNKTKLAAGWLIEQAGWKGKTFGNYGVHKKQSLVLVNYGGAKGSDIYQLSEDIMHSVFDKFGIELEREVNIL